MQHGLKSGGNRRGDEPCIPVLTAALCVLTWKGDGDPIYIHTVADYAKIAVHSCPWGLGWGHVLPRLALAERVCMVPHPNLGTGQIGAGEPRIL